MLRWFVRKKKKNTNQRIINSIPSSKTNTIKIITDEPLISDHELSEEEDALNFNDYSEKLADIITNSTPRFAIGIFGGWGTGKTTLMNMIEKKLENRDDILVVWFDAWKYEKEKYLAVIPFIRTIEIELENKLLQLKKTKKRLENNTISLVKDERWNQVRKGLEKTFNAFTESTNLNLGLGNYGSAGINLAKFRNTLRADGRPIEIDNERIYYHRHISEHLEDALSILRDSKKGGNPNSRIVVFIDDLDRCAPEKALEVLESLKTFFDIEGIIYVIGMDSDTINSLIKKKYGEDFGEGFEYMQKIVQLPFQIPSWKEGWKEEEISESILKIISRGLEGSELVEQFKNNKKLIVKAVELNPREIKRFVNNIILAKAVFNESVDKLIVVQALNFRRNWRTFLELITPDEKRKKFLHEYEYMNFKDKIKDITSEEELKKFGEDDLNKEKYSLFNENLKIYQEIIKQGNDLRSFLDSAIPILKDIEKMEKLRIALNAGKFDPTTELLKLLREGKVEQFNKIRSAYNISDLKFSLDMPTGANLSGANLSYANISYSNLPNANLYNSSLFNANLSYANLTNANLTYAKFDYTNLSHATLVGAKQTSWTVYNYVDMSKSNLSNCRLIDFAFYNVNLSEANLTKAELLAGDAPVDFRRCNLSRANLRGAKLKGAYFENTDLSHADLLDAYIWGGDFRDTNISYSDLSNVKLIAMGLSQTNLSHSNLSNSIILDCNNFNQLLCDQADFNNAIISNKELADYLKEHNAKNVPTPIIDKKELEKKLEERGFVKE